VNREGRVENGWNLQSEVDEEMVGVDSIPNKIIIAIIDKAKHNERSDQYFL